MTTMAIQRAPAQPQLYAWGARALYIGPAFGLSPHRNAVAVLALALEQPFGVALDPRDAGTSYRACRSVLIPGNTLHHFRPEGSMAFLYVDARSHDFDRMLQLSTDRTPRAAFDLVVEDDLLSLLGALAQRRRSWADVRHGIASILGWRRNRLIDPRVRKALERLHADPAARPSLAELARDACLSESRFLHLFKEATGVPLRRYKLWCAMGVALRAIAAGETLTTAAFAAGFSSSAHFSATYRATFGLEPSRLLRTGFTAELGAHPSPAS
jgi:AraC-like DNA-binding protein